MVARFNETTLNYAQKVRAHMYVYVCPKKKKNHSLLHGCHCPH